MKIIQTFIVTLTLVSFTGCGVVNMLRIRNANDDITPVMKANQTQVNLATHYIGVKPYVEVSINGIDGFKFMLDTGASYSILTDSNKVKALKLKQGYSLPMKGWGDGEDSTAYETKAEKVSLNGVDFHDVTFAYLPLSGTQYFLDKDELIYDGIIGHDILHHFSWIFDKKNNQISISTLPYKVSEQDKPNVTTLPFDVFLSKLYIDVGVDFGQNQQVQQELKIDTGSRHYLKVDNGYIHSENIKLPTAQITGADFGLSGRTVHQRVTVPELRLNGLSLEHVKTNVIGDRDGDGDEWWVIGNALMGQYKTIVDYHSSKFHLIAYDDTSFKSAYNLLGLELRKLNSGNFIVRYVFPQLASHAFDFKKGDRITSINGQASANISLENYLAISNQVGVHNVCRIRAQANEQGFEITTKEIAGYSVR